MAFFRFVKDQLFVTPPYPTQDFTGQTVIVTGANVGLGLEASRHFTRLHAATVILGVRDLEKGEQAKRSIEESTQRFNVVHVWPLDLSRYQSVEDFARRVHTLERLDVLVENAGIVAPTYREYEDDEATITVNVVSTFLLALLVLPKLQETATRFHVQPHLVIVSSEAHGMASMAERKSASIFEALRDKETARMQDRYGTMTARRVHALNLNRADITCLNSSKSSTAGSWRCIIRKAASRWSSSIM
jgi:NAD(P)-dependent dehydrogenase (short-subunit alcohol dehydrogenase family)